MKIYSPFTHTAVLFSVFVSSYCHSQQLNESGIQKRAETWHAEHQQPTEGIVITNIKEDEVVHGTAGVLGEGRGEVNEHTLFEIGSISKVFTGVLLADTILQGKAELHDPITKYLPKGVVGEDSPLHEVTLFELSTHTSGFPKVPNNLREGSTPGDPYAHYDRDLLFAYLNEFEESQFQNRGEYLYSNVAIGLLGELIAMIHDTTYEEHLKSVIFEPLGMQNSFLQIDADSIPDTHTHLFATGHNAGYPVSYWRINSLASAGAIVTDSVDMAKFAKAHWADSTPERLKNAMALAAQKHTDKVGLAWHYTSDDRLYHGGGTGGFRTRLIINLPNQSANIRFCNSSAERAKLEAPVNMSEIAGFWEGTLNLGAQKLRLVLSVSEKGSSVYSLDQGCSIITATSSSYSEGEFEFKFTSIRGAFTGKLEDGNLVGAWAQARDIPLVMTRSEGMPESLESVFRKRYTGNLDPIEGWWSGKIGGEGGLLFLLEVIKHSDCYEVKAWSPTQAPVALTVSSTKFDDKKLVVKLNQVGGEYKAKFDPQEMVLEGNWIQGVTSSLRMTHSRTRPH